MTKVKSRSRKNITVRISWPFLLFLIYCFNFSYAADLDEVYGPLVKKGSVLYAGKVNFFVLDEEGTHGSSTEDKFEAAPCLPSFGNLLKFSPLDSLELALGLDQDFPAKYKRFTYNNSGGLASIQKYEIDYFMDFILGLRIRRGPTEAYLDISEKRQKTNWGYGDYPAPANYFSYIRAHYEDFKLGLRFLSEEKTPQEQSNLSKLSEALLSDNQMNLEAELGYKKGKLRRTTDYYHSAGLYIYNFYHVLKPHFIPKIAIRYGLNKDLEVGTGLFYTTPFKYEYEYKRYDPGGTSRLIFGAYKLKNNFYVPLSLRYRPRTNLEFMFSSDFNSITQKLDYREKNIADTVINYPPKKLIYYNTIPTLKVAFLCDDKKKIQEDEFSALTKDLLLKNQCLIEFLYKKDITHLRKGSSNGPQNIIDPYNVFLYPLDYFVAGSEYASFFTGNYSKTATNILPQNYYLCQVGFNYGVTDNLNAGFRFGYHSSSSLHHFTLSDMVSRFYRFRPYYYFDTSCDWRVSKNSLFSFNSRFIPKYTTYLTEGEYPDEFHSKNNYVEVSFSLKILF